MWDISPALMVKEANLAAAITRAMGVEAAFFVAYAGVWWTVGAGCPFTPKPCCSGLAQQLWESKARLCNDSAVPWV